MHRVDCKTSEDRDRMWKDRIAFPEDAHLKQTAVVIYPLSSTQSCIRVLITVLTEPGPPMDSWMS